jgi:protein-tyrosine phosphatase
MTREAHDALKSAGISDPVDHRSRPLIPDLLADADVVYVMTEQHRQALREQFPAASAPVFLLDPTGEDISDPIGGPPVVYERALQAIQSSLERRLPEILGEQETR